MPLLRCPVFSGEHLLAAALILGQNGEAVRHADIITDQSQELECIGILPQLQPSFKVHRVDDEVTMDVVGIAVGGDKDFRAGPCTGSEFQSNLMRLLGSDILCWFEGLHILIEVDAVHFSVSCLCCFELQNGIHPIAVDATNKTLTGLFIPGLVLSHAVPHDTSHGADVLPGFPNISYGSYAASPPRLMR